MTATNTEEHPQIEAPARPALIASIGRIAACVASYLQAAPLALILACLLAPLSPQVLPIAVSLFLLGLGWNFCFVGGSSLLSDRLSPLERAKTQGFNDTLIALASGTGSLGSGVVFAALGYRAMGFAGVLVALAPLALILWWQMGRPRLVAGGPAGE